MSYRITINTATVECDTPAEVLALAALIDKPKCAGSCATPGAAPIDPAKDRGWPASIADSDTESYQPGDAISAGVVLHNEQAEGPVAVGKRYSADVLADAPKPKKPIAIEHPTAKPRKSVIYGEPADDFEEDPEPPRRKPEPAKAVAPNEGDRLAEKIRKLLAKEGALGIATIALSIGEPTRTVKDFLRSRTDLFRLHPRAGGWELKS